MISHSYNTAKISAPIGYSDTPSCLHCCLHNITLTYVLVDLFRIIHGTTYTPFLFHLITINLIIILMAIFLSLSLVPAHLLPIICLSLAVSCCLIALLAAYHSTSHCTIVPSLFQLLQPAIEHEWVR